MVWLEYKEDVKNNFNQAVGQSSIKGLERGLFLFLAQECGHTGSTDNAPDREDCTGQGGLRLKMFERQRNTQSHGYESNNSPSPAFCMPISMLRAILWRESKPNSLATFQPMI